MSTIRAILSLFVILCAIATSQAAETPAADWNNAFARDMLRQLGEELPDENFTFSPFSIVTAFGMAYAGSRGETAAEMEEMFRFVGQETTHALMDEWTEAVLAGVTGRFVDFHLANRVWLQKDWQVEDEFIRVMEEEYAGSLGYSDFINNWEAERLIINEWVAEQTLDRITDLLPANLNPPAVNNATRFALVNALYFQALWTTAFPDASTSDQPFHVSDDETMTVRMMKGSMGGPYIQTEMAQAVGLEVKDGSYRFVVVVPRSEYSLGEVRDAIGTGAFPLNIKSWNRTGIDLELPRFLVKSVVDLKRVLVDMGLVGPFMMGADFSGIHTGVERGLLYLQGAFHQAFLEVTETGLKAGAATAITGGARGSKPRIVANRPFLFFLMEADTETVLFAGQVIRPENPPEVSLEGFEGWRVKHFTGPELADPSISGAEAVPAGDGVANLAKFVFGLDPLESTEAPMSYPSLIQVDGGLHPAVAFPVSREASEGSVQFTLQRSSDLVHWHDAEFESESLRSGALRLIHNDPIRDRENVFLRVRISLPADNSQEEGI